MSHIRSLAVAIAGIGLAALTVSAADSQRGPYGYSRGPYAGAYASSEYGGYASPGSYCSYCADRANPSVSPNGWDQDNPRDRQLQGTR